MEEVVEEEEEVEAVFEGGGQEITISQFNQILFSYGPHQKEGREEERGSEKRREEGKNIKDISI